MGSTSPSVKSSQEMANSPPLKATPEPTGQTENIEKVLAPESALSPQSQQSTDRKSKIWLEVVGGRKMAAYLVSVIATSTLALMGAASTEVLLSIQTALGLLVGGNAAEHKFTQQREQQ